MAVSQSPAELMVSVLGEDAPPVPATAEQFKKLPMTLQATLREKAPAFVQSLLAAPEGLPAAVAVRLEKGTLEMCDVDALRAAGMLLEAEQVIAREGERQLQKLQSDLADFRKSREVPEEHRKQNEAREKEIRRMSLNGVTGRIN